MPTYARSLVMLAIALTPSLALGAPPPPEDQISADDKAILITETKAFIKSCTGCKTPGFDLDKNDVKVSADDLALRDQWVRDAMTPGKNDNRTWGALKDDCKLRSYPKLKLDVAVIKLWQVNTLAEPLVAALGTLDGQCTYTPASPAIVSFIQGIKTIHFTLAHPFPGATHAGYLYSFNKKTGELTIGLHNHGGPDAALAHDWFVQISGGN